MNSNFSILKRQLDDLLEERDRLFPIRDSQNTSATRQAESAVVDLMVRDIPAKSSPSPKLQETVKKLLPYPVFIGGNMKSGTTMLVEHLDAHPELLVLPGDTHLVSKFLKPPHKLNKKEIDKIVRLWTRRWINPKGQIPFWVMGQEPEPYQKFYQYFNYWIDKTDEDERAIIHSIVGAFLCANPEAPERPQLWVEKTPGNEFSYELLNELFPQAKFIYVVRDPFKNMASQKRLHIFRGWEWQIDRVIKEMAKGLALVQSLAEQWGKDKLLVVRHEDLVADAAAEMKQVASFLGIEANASLQTATINGLATKPNSMYARDPQAKSQKHKLSDLEKAKILARLRNGYKSYGYQLAGSEWEYLIAKLRMLIS